MEDDGVQPYHHPFFCMCVEGSTERSRDHHDVNETVPRSTRTHTCNLCRVHNDSIRIVSMCTLYVLYSLPCPLLSKRSNKLPHKSTRKILSTNDVLLKERVFTTLNIIRMTVTSIVSTRSGQFAANWNASCYMMPRSHIHINDVTKPGRTMKLTS